MFFLVPLLPVLAVYIAAAVLPAILLLRYVYRHDTVEKEPPGLLGKLLFTGILAALCASVLEILGERLLNAFLHPSNPLHTILLAFLVVAAVEEACKFFFLQRATWHHPAFNYRFDAIVYAVFVSLGFAAYENILYVFQYGLSVALPRALLAIPGHMSFAVYMGLFYGRAKLCQGNGDYTGQRQNLWAGYLWAVFFHGFYDACAMTASMLSTVIFLIFVLFLDICVYRLLKRESAADTPV